MNAPTLSTKNNQRKSRKPLNYPKILATSALPTAGHEQEESGDRAISSQLLFSETPRRDSDGLLNPIIESSGSDHHSDSQTSSRPSSRPRASSDTHLHTSSRSSRGSTSPAVSPDIIDAGANAEDHTCISLSMFKSSGPQALASNIPQPITTSSSAPDTPSTSDNQTYSFVFTSSRQPKILGDETLIGVVNPSISKEPALPKTRPTFSPKQHRKSTLTPEQIRAHALGAIHAISSDSPFHSAEHARPSTVVQMDLPLQRPMLSENVDPVDRSLQRHGIDFYVNAARQGRNKIPQTTGSSSRSPNIRPFSQVATLESVGEDTGQTAVLDPLLPTGKTRSGRPLRKGNVKNYSRYIEDESNEATFTTTGCAVVRREPSIGSSTSSSRSRQSIDESLTGLLCFGVIGSGTPSTVFGSAVISPGPLAPPGQQLAILKGPSSTPTVKTKPPRT